MSKHLISISSLLLLALASFAWAGNAHADEPSVTYSTLTPAPNSQVTATVSGNTNNITYRWQWSSDGSTWRNAGEPGYNTDTLTVPDKPGMHFRLAWTYNRVWWNYASSHVTITEEAAEETVTYSTTAPAPGSQVTATLSGDTTGVAYQWQWSRDGSHWENAGETGHDTDTFTVPNKPGMKFRVSWTRNGDRNYADSYVTVSDPPQPIADLTASYSTTAPAPGSQVTATLSGGDTTGVAYQWQWSPNGFDWGDAGETGHNTDTFTVPNKPGMKFRVSWTHIGVRYYADSYVTVAEETVSYSTLTPAPYSRVTATLSGGSTGVAYQWQWSRDGSLWANAGETGHNTDTFTVPNKPGMKFRVSWTRGGISRSAASHVTVTEPPPPPPPILPALVILNSTSTPPTVTYSTLTPPPNTTVTATLSSTTGVTAYQWQYSIDGATWDSAGELGNTTTTLTTPHYDGVYFRISWTRNGTQEYASAYVTVTSVVTYSTLVPAPTTAVTATLSTTTGVTAYQWQWSINGHSWGDAGEPGSTSTTLTMPWKPDFKFRLTWTRNGVRETSTNYVTIPHPRTTGLTWVNYNPRWPLGDTDVTATFGGNTNNITAYQWQWSHRGRGWGVWDNAGEPGYNTKTITVPDKPDFWFRITWVRNGVWERMSHNHYVGIKHYVPVGVARYWRTAQDVGTKASVIMSGSTDKVTAYRWQWRSGCRLASSSDVWTDVAATVPGYNTRWLTLPTTRTWAKYRISWLNNGVWEYSPLNSGVCALPAGTFNEQHP